jgi:maltokinase
MIELRSTDILADLIRQWLPRQRWFAGKGRTFVISLRALTTLTDQPPQVTIWLADVAFDGGNTDIYQMPLVVHRQAQSGLEHVLVGTVPEADGTRWIYDALHEKQVTLAWLGGIRDEAHVGAVRFERFVPADEVPVGSTSLVLTAEQSNTSLVYGDDAILKVFRRLERGLNPDIEVHAALGKLGARHVARLLGAVSADIDGESVSLAMLQEFMTTASDGWELARTSVRDLMNEADLHASEAGGDFASEARRLGVATAEVHADLAVAFGTGTLAAPERAVRAASMHARLDAALRIVPQLAAVEAGVRSIFDDFAAVDAPLPTQRVHGDLHLGQTLRTVHRWVILDFEGEPSSPISERRVFDSPLRDLAGMLRSFDYAARFQLVGTTASPQLEYRAVEWAERNRDAYRAGYTSVAGSDPAEDLQALRGFEADKAVYEVVYEARNRPSWLQIPLRSLTRLANAAGQEGSS